MRWISFFKKKKNETYKWEQLPKGRKTLKNKCVFKLKRDNSGKLMKYKTWLVIKGFRQKKWLRDIVEENAAKLKKIHTNKNVLDMLTKVVLKQKFQLCMVKPI